MLFLGDYFMQAFIEYFFSNLRFICYPFLWIKCKLLGLDKIKAEICNIFNKIEKTNTYKPEDYHLNLSFFNGFFLINKQTGRILASGKKFASYGCIDVRDFDIFNMEFFDNSTLEKIKSPNMSYLKTFNSFYIFYEKNTITSVQNNIKFYARFNDDFLLEEELIITLCLQWNNQFEVNEIVKKTYDFLDCRDSKLYNEKMESPFDIQKESTKIIEDIIEKEKAYIPTDITS